MKLSWFSENYSKKTFVFFILDNTYSLRKNEATKHLCGAVNSLFEAESVLQQLDRMTRFWLYFKAVWDL